MRGTPRAARLLAKWHPPNRAIAAMGVKLGACGTRRDVAAASVMARSVRNRGFNIGGLLSKTDGSRADRPALGLALGFGLRQQIGKVPRIALDHFTDPHWNGPAEDGPIVDERVELAVLATGIYTLREVSDQIAINRTAGELLRELAAIDAGQVSPEPQTNKGLRSR